MAPAWRGAHLEGWLFEDAQARRAAEARLAQAGVQARFRSAYKPLLHYFLEEVERDGLIAAEIRYPLHEHAQAKRFTLEAYPLVALLDGVRVTLQPGASDLHYDVDLRYADGREIQSRVFALNQLGHAPDGVAELSPTGWLRVRDAAGETRVDAAQATEYQLAFRAAVDAVRTMPGAPTNPTSSAWRSASTCQASTSRCRSTRKSSAPTRRCTRTCTSLLEHFQQHSAARPATAACSPGRSFPTCAATTAPRACASRSKPSRPYRRSRPPCPASRWRRRASRYRRRRSPAAWRPWAATRSRPPRARAGRCWAPTCAAPVPPSSFPAPSTPTKPPAWSARARRRRWPPAAGHFALIAAENPDGYALFARLREQHPRHMLHASRYSALGDDIAYRERAPFFERDGRHQAHAISGAQLHINLHGYPAHEWTRPLSGYLPRHFELWTIPKGFFLVLRHHPGWGERARRLIEGVTARLARNVPGLVEFNARQLELFRAHALETGFAVMNGIPVQVTETDREELPMALISEFPDETVYGDRYVFAHTVQMETVLAATDIYRSGL